MKSLFLFLFVLAGRLAGAQSGTIVVAQDGSGSFTTVQAAFDALPAAGSQPVLIYVKNGVYREKLHLPRSGHRITLQGQDRMRTILTYDDHTGKLGPQGDTINTYTSQSFWLEADDFTALNISFQNDAGFSAGQAVAVRADGDRSIFRNCRFLGNQDVLFPSKPATRQYFERCYIEGTTDFIFGPSAAWFDHCEIFSKKASHVTAASTPQEAAYGYVFHECALVADTSLHGTSLGRPWRPYASVTYLNCYIGTHILPEGWNNWKNAANEKTARFSEYKSCGPGGSPARRLPWTHQLSDEAAKDISFTSVFGNWNPLHNDKK